MGQKTSPIGFRTGIRLGWQSMWYASKIDYGNCLVEDQKIREIVDRKYNRQMPRGGVAKVQVMRTRSNIKVTLHSGRPGVVIGPRGQEVDNLRLELEELTGRKVSVNVVEVKEPELDAQLMAESVAERLAKRSSFRRTMKQHCEAAMNAGARGVKIICGGRLGGSELARRETQMKGSIPLHTLDADIGYGVSTARTTYGAVGVKVWVYRRNFGEEIEQRVVSGHRAGSRRVSPGGRRGGGVKGGRKSGPRSNRAKKVEQPRRKEKKTVQVQQDEPESGLKTKPEPELKSKDEPKKGLKTKPESKPEDQEKQE